MSITAEPFSCSWSCWKQEAAYAGQPWALQGREAREASGCQGGVWLPSAAAQTAGTECAGRVEAGPQSLRKMCPMRQIHCWRPWCWGKLWAGGKRGKEDEMVKEHHWFNRQWVWANFLKDREAWHAAVHGVAKNRMWLSSGTIMGQRTADRCVWECVCSVHKTEGSGIFHASLSHRLDALHFINLNTLQLGLKAQIAMADKAVRSWWSYPTSLCRGFIFILCCWGCCTAWVHMCGPFRTVIGTQ